MDWSQHESDHDKALLLGHHTTGLLAESEDDFAALSDPTDAALEAYPFVLPPFPFTFLFLRPSSPCSVGCRLLCCHNPIASFLRTPKPPFSARFAISNDLPTTRPGGEKVPC
jgi:hypothetical protein